MTATFTVTVADNRTSVRVEAPRGTIPLATLNAAIEALEDERRRIERCPAHRAAEAAEAFSAAAQGEAA